MGTAQESQCILHQERDETVVYFLRQCERLVRLTVRLF